jgi:gas vesicle protein GvpK
MTAAAETPMCAAPPPPSQDEKLRIDLKPDNVRNGIGKLVLTVVELLRQLLEKQAQRRVESGALSEAEVERLGMTFLCLAEQMEVMKKALGLEGDDLNLDLGPLGKLF